MYYPSLSYDRWSRRAPGWHCATQLWGRCSIECTGLGYMTSYLLEQISRALAYAVLLSVSTAWLRLVRGVFTCIVTQTICSPYVFEEYFCLKDHRKKCLAHAQRKDTVLRASHRLFFMIKATLGILLQSMCLRYQVSGQGVLAWSLQLEHCNSRCLLNGTEGLGRWI